MKLVVCTHSSQPHHRLPRPTFYLAITVARLVTLELEDRRRSR
jgi:hypothetical protein